MSQGFDARTPEGFAVLYRYCRSILPVAEDAEDAAMEALQAILATPRILQGRRDPMRYAIGIARRKVFAKLRASRSAGWTAEPSDDPQPSLLVQVALWRLSVEHREVLCLRFALGLSASETGELMGRTPAAIDSLVQRAKAAFREVYGDIEEKEPCVKK